MATGLNMKNVLSQLEEKQRATADKPKPPVSKPPTTGSQPASSAAAQPPFIKPLKPVVQTPKPDTTDSGKPLTNGAHKWPPVKTTTGPQKQADSDTNPPQAPTGPSNVTKPGPKPFGANASGPNPVAKPGPRPFGANASAGAPNTSGASPVSNKPTSLQLSDSSEVSPSPKPGPVATSPGTSTHVQPAAGRERGIKIPPIAPVKPGAKSPGVKSPGGMKLTGKDPQKTFDEAASADVQSQPTAATRDENLPVPPWKAQLKKRGSLLGDNKSDNNNNISSSSNNQAVAPAVARKIPTSSDVTVSEFKQRIAKMAEKFEPPPNTGGSVVVAEQSSHCTKTEPESSPTSDQSKAVSFSPVPESDSKNPIDISSSNGIVTVGTKSYRLISFSDVMPHTATLRKPAKPPAVDLTAYRQQADVSDGADDGEIYDDVQCSSDDILRPSRRPVSTASRISEYTEEEECSRLQTQNSGSDGVEEIYDDVGGNPDEYEDGLIYQELD